MREILFRGKRADNGEWVEGSLLVDYPCCKNGIDETVRLFSILNLKTSEKVVKKVEVIPETVGQYTGLTDKNGTKIFEGDIIYKPPKYRIDTGETYKIIFANGSFQCDYLDESFSFCFDDLELGITLDEFEIIGNIHDNPELLKGGVVDE